MAKVLTRQTVLGLYEDISTPGFFEAVGLLKTIDVSVKLNTASHLINNKNDDDDDDNGKFET
jgi:hypothetical protein